MAYSGKYTVKLPEKYRGDPSKVVYRSLWEKYCFMWCDKNTSVKFWSSEEVVIPYLFEGDKKWHRYFMDLKITFENGKTILVEVKPEVQTRPPVAPPKKTKRYLEESFTFIKNQNKWKAAEKYANRRGWEFVIWTEKELEKFGIMPKSVKKLRPLKKLKK